MLKKQLIKYLIIIALVTLFILAGWYFISRNPKFRFGTQRAGVITQIQSLARLETASYTIDKVIEAGTDYGKINQFLFGDKLVLIAHGQVIAGYDLSRMKPEDFSGVGKSITIRVPQPEIFTVTIDNQQTKVFDRSQGLFTKGELNLEAEARQQAEESILQAACEGGILAAAEKNLKAQLETIFKSSGFNSVQIITQSGNNSMRCLK